MALPHMPSYYTTRKNIYEAAIVRKRTKEHDFREKWSNVADYFHKENVSAAKKKNWESDTSFQMSMDAFSNEKAKELKLLNLKRRRSKLGEMLAEERHMFEAELKQLSKGNYLRLEDMKERSEELKSAREEKRQQLALDLMYEHWRQNNPDIRELESKKNEECVIETWREQLEEQKRREEEARRELEELERQMEEERQEAVQREQEKEREKREKEKQLKAMLKEQMEELRQREREAEMLRRQEEQLQRAQWELELMEAKQKEMERARKKLEFGRVLLRQHAAALRRKSRQIQEELEEDHKFLQMLAEQEEKDVAVQSARREKARADAAWMMQVVEEQIKVEKAREAELDMLYQDEAAKIWQKRENEWAKERQARERLMREVLEARQQQILEKMEAVKEQQRESIERREELLKEMEIINQLTRREQERKEMEKLAIKQEIETQVTARQEQQYAAKKSLEEELALERKAEEEYEELLRREAEQLRIKDFAPKDFPRKTAWM